MSPPKPLTAIALCFTLIASVCEDSVRGEVVGPNRLSVSEQRGGWDLLFDGKTTTGWRNYRSDVIGDGWTVVDGTLQRANQGAGDIVTVDQYDNFELSLEYRISKGGNSGVMFRVLESEDAPWQTGPEVQVQDNIDGHDPEKSGWLYQLYRPQIPKWSRQIRQRAGLKVPEVTDATRPAGEWNQIYLRVTDDQCEVAVNGISYYKFRLGDDNWKRCVAESKFADLPNFGTADKGHICLQDHGDDVAFRSIKVRRLLANGDVLKQPIDGKLALRGTLAFPNLEWQDWEPYDERGRAKPLRILVLTPAGDATNRLFAATQSGVIHVFENRSDVATSRVFLDISGQVFDWKKGNESGMLGLAFHPNYSQNGYFYVYYTDEASGDSRVSRFTVSDGDANRADPTSEKIVMKIKQPFPNHNGGSIEFGPDGFLYIGLGDGGDRNDPLAAGQDAEQLLGSILRIDVDRSERGKAYGVPGDNPFVGKAPLRREVYASGFRNVWRLAFDRDTGDLWAGDVGQDLWEEVNLVRRGGNYGWSVREGDHLFGNRQSESEQLQGPVWEYDHRVGKSITGGRVYRSSRLPDLNGMYFYADYVSGRIWALKYDRYRDRVVANYEIGDGGTPVLAFGEDADGEIYYITAAADGRAIYRFERE